MLSFGFEWQRSFLRQWRSLPMKTLCFHSCAGLLAAVSLSSCVTPYPGPHERVGGVLGAATGALAGGIIGHQSGSGLEGAAIGGVLGALAGSALGSVEDDYAYGSPRYGYRHAPPPPAYGGYYYAPRRPRHYYHHHHPGPYYGDPCW